jgi:signal peptidase I
MLRQEKIVMNNIIWLIGAIVVVLAILSFLGLR